MATGSLAARHSGKPSSNRRASVEPSGMKLVHVVKVPLYHYGAVFENPPT
jgi:hypothetical protein